MTDLKENTEATIEGVKKEYQAKHKALEVKSRQAQDTIEQAEKLKKTLKENADRQAQFVIEEKSQELEKKYKTKVASHYVYMSLMSAFGILVTVLEGVTTKAVFNDFKSFFGAIWSFLCMSFQSVFKVAKWSAKLGDKIPQEVVATIVHWLLFLLVIGLSVLGVALGIKLLITKFVPWFTEELADLTTLTVVLISSALLTFFGELLKDTIFTKCNLCLIWVIVFASYSILRVYTKPNH